MKKFTLLLAGGKNLVFRGKYMQSQEKPNWHYYEDAEGSIYHIRKQHMIAVIEESV